MRYSWLFWILFFFTCKLFALEIPINAPTKEVLLLHSYHKGYRWSDDISKVIEERLSLHGGVDLTTVYMDTKRIDTPSYKKRLARLYEEQFATRKFDVIIVSDNSAFDFAVQYHKTLFNAAPIVFLGINHFDTTQLVQPEMRPFMTGVMEKVDIASNIELMQMMRPKLKKVFIINDRTTTGLAIRNEMEKVLPLFEGQLRFEYVDDIGIKSLKEKVGQLGDDTAILFLLLFKDRTGKYFTYKESLQEVRSVSNVPIFGLWDFYLGLGVVGGKVTSAKAQGEAAVNMALRILQGESPADIPILGESPNRYLFDYKELQNYGLEIPVSIGAHEVVNAPFSFYEEYKSLVWTTVVIFVTISLLALILAFNVIRRRKSEKALQNQLVFIRVLLDTVQNPIFYKDVSGTYLGCNDAFAQLLDKPKDEIIGKTIFELFPPKWAREHSARDRQLLREMGSDTVESTLHIHGEMKHFIIHNSAYFNMDGTAGGIVCIMDNITDRIQQKQFLIQQSKLAEMGEMIAAVAHQWNEPLVELSAIIQDIEMAYYNEELDDNFMKSFVKDSMVQVQYMSKTLKDFRNFLKPSTKKDSFSVRGALDGIMEIIGRQVFYSNINLFINYRPEKGDIEVYGYENEFKQVLLNIINNAKNKIIKKYKGTEKVGIITINVYRNENSTAIQIIDDAGTIDQSIIGHVFDPYFTTSPEGTGLGLYMAKVIIEDKMGGRISVSNGENSVIFMIEVPNCKNCAISN